MWPLDFNVILCHYKKSNIQKSILNWIEVHDNLYSDNECNEIINSILKKINSRILK